jgi:hypothetical protein
MHKAPRLQTAVTFCASPSLDNKSRAVYRLFRMTKDASGLRGTGLGFAGQDRSYNEAHENDVCP